MELNKIYYMDCFDGIKQLEDNSVSLYVDTLKANVLKINLITDQLVHMLQIVVTWSAFILT